MEYGLLFCGIAYMYLIALRVNSKKCTMMLQDYPHVPAIFVTPVDSSIVSPKLLDNEFEKYFAI